MNTFTLGSLSSVLAWIFLPKVSNKRPGSSQISRASVHENQGNLDFFLKKSIKRPALSQF